MQAEIQQPGRYRGPFQPRAQEQTMLKTLIAAKENLKRAARDFIPVVIKGRIPDELKSYGSGGILGDMCRIRRNESEEA